MRFIAVLTIIVFLLILAPAIFIWGINELLEQAGVANQIPWNFWTWLAAFAVGGVCTAGKV